MKQIRANHPILVTLIVGIFLFQASCSSRSNGDAKPAVLNNDGKVVAQQSVITSQEDADSCDSDGGEVVNFGIVGGRTISQKSPLARGVVKLYTEYYDNSTNAFISAFACTGALIDANIIITAAHCFEAPKVEGKSPGSLSQKVYVMYGSNPFCKVDKGDFSRVFLVDDIRVHESYGKKDGMGDIALLRTQKPMVGGHTYYKLDAQTHDFKVDEKLVAIGYGKTKGYFIKEDKEAPLKMALLGSNKVQAFERKFTDKIFTTISAEVKRQLYDNFDAKLKKENQPLDRPTVEVMVDEYLKNTFIKNLFFSYTDSRENLLFDQSNHEGICAGDSGGPGLRQHADTLRIVGVAKSVAAESAQNDSCSFSAIYTNVSFHKAWIIKNFNELANKDSTVRGRGELVFE